MLGMYVHILDTYQSLQNPEKIPDATDSKDEEIHLKIIWSPIRLDGLFYQEI